MVLKDPEAQKAYVREWNQRHYHQRRQAWFASRGGKCEKCGSTGTLECDHIDRSTKEHHRIWTWSDERREAELEKCQALCVPCHQEKTTAEFRARPDGHGLWMYARFHCKCDVCVEAKRESRMRYEARKRKGKE